MDSLCHHVSLPRILFSPGWGMRLQSYTATEPCLVLWPELRLHEKPMSFNFIIIFHSPSPGILCSAFLSFSQSGSTSCQLLATFHWASLTHDRAILTCSSSLEILFGQKMLQIFRRQLLQKTSTFLISVFVTLQHSEPCSRTA